MTPHVAHRGRGWLPWLAAALLALAALIAMTARTASGGGEVFDFGALMAAGLKDDAAIAGGEIDRLVQAGLVHVSWTHLTINALAFTFIAFVYWRFLGPLQRSWLAAAGMLAIGVIASTAAFAVSFLLRTGPSCGASAAIYGILGAVAGRVWIERDLLPERLRLAAPLMLTMVSLASALVLLPNPGIDHAAHISGWAGGLPLGMLARTRRGLPILVATASALVAFAVAV